MISIPMLAMLIWGLVYILKVRDKVKALYKEIGEEEEPLEIKL